MAHKTHTARVLAIGLMVMAAGWSHAAQGAKAADAEAVKLKPAARIQFEAINESSGLARSRRHPGVYWTHNDSGDTARIFAIRRDGSLVKPAGVAESDYKGIEVEGASNVDWEDIAADEQGHLIIEDCGNNANKRRNLAVYIVNEPDPERDLKATVVKKLPVYYPEQRFNEGEPKNYDCEAVFVAGGRIHLLTKQRGDHHTRLYRLETEKTDAPNALKLVDEFDAGGLVTAADASPDGRRLAMLTYDAVWLFEAKADEDYFHGRIRMLPVKAGQCESICFEEDGKTLLMGNEGRSLFSVAIESLRPWKDLIKVTQ